MQEFHTRERIVRHLSQNVCRRLYTCRAYYDHAMPNIPDELFSKLERESKTKATKLCRAGRFRRWAELPAYRVQGPLTLLHCTLKMHIDAFKKNKAALPAEADLNFEIWDEDGDAGGAESVSCRRRRLWVKAKDGWRVGVRVCAGLFGGACRVLAAGTAVAPNFRPAED